MNLKRRFLKKITDRAADVRFGEGQAMELNGLVSLNCVYQTAWD